MKRFRYTLIAVSLVLLLLGSHDLVLWWQNPSPTPIAIADLQASGAPSEWLRITGGFQDLDRAISTSGTIELEALLIPLLQSPGQDQIHVLVETHQPELLELFREYHFLTDTLPEKKALRERHKDLFKGPREVTGMMASGLVSKGNHQKLIKLAQQTGLNLSDDVLFLSEGKQPGKWRGLFFTVVGLLGLLKIFSGTGRSPEITK